MKILRHTSTVALVLVVAACAETHHSRGRVENEKGKNDPEFREKIEKLAQACESLKVDAIAPFYEEKTFAQILEPKMTTITGRGEHHAAVGRYLDSVARIHVELIGDIQAWKENKKVWTLQGFHLTGALKSGKAVDLTGRHSAIWEKRGDQWLIVYEHLLGPPAVVPTPRPA